MIKLGVETCEIEIDKAGLLKTAGRGPKETGCEHPPGSVQTDKGVLFCHKCQKYLVEKKGRSS